MINSGVDPAFLIKKKKKSGYLHWFRVKGLSQSLFLC